MMKVLFVCTGNVDRSKTAEKMLEGTPGLETKSAGTAKNANTRLSRELVQWAQRIFIMEQRHQSSVLELDPKAGKKIQCLNIPDIYTLNDPKLKQLLKRIKVRD